LPYDCALALAELTIEQLFWDAGDRHAGDVTCSSDLGIARDGDDAGGVCSLQDLFFKNIMR